VGGQGQFGLACLLLRRRDCDSAGCRGFDGQHGVRNDEFGHVGCACRIIDIILV